MKYDVIVIGAGYAGSISAHKFASDEKKVLIIERRNHIGGNMYDYIDENGVRYHKYGPHIFHTVNDKVECVCDGSNLKYKPEKLDCGYYVQNIFEYFEYLNSSSREKDIKRIPLVKNYIKKIK